MASRLTEITQQVAEEWRKEGKLLVPPDKALPDPTDAFWDEVQRRYDEQVAA
jgi:hypothetical protein